MYATYYEFRMRRSSSFSRKFDRPRRQLGIPVPILRLIQRNRTHPRKRTAVSASHGRYILTCTAQDPTTPAQTRSVRTSAAHRWPSSRMKTSKSFILKRRTICRRDSKTQMRFWSAAPSADARVSETRRWGCLRWLARRDTTATRFWVPFIPRDSARTAGYGTSIPFRGPQCRPAQLSHHAIMSRQPWRRRRIHSPISSPWSIVNLAWHLATVSNTPIPRIVIEYGEWMFWRKLVMRETKPGDHRKLNGSIYYRTERWGSTSRNTR